MREAVAGVAPAAGGGQEMPVGFGSIDVEGVQDLGLMQERDGKARTQGAPVPSPEVGRGGAGAVGKGEMKRGVSRRLGVGLEHCISDGKGPVVVEKETWQRPTAGPYPQVGSRASHRSHVGPP